MGMRSKFDFWEHLWETWDLRIVILISLFLQTFLIFSAPLRKRMAEWYVVMPMWLAYLLADATANFAVGLISKTQSQSDKTTTTTPPGADSGHSNSTNADLLAFWAPFLLVHLGGPDTITAFALADNELWLRHLLGLGFQCWAVAYSFSQSFPKNDLWLPTVLMFCAGIIKYTERTRSLFLASSRRFRDSLLTNPDPGPNYAKLMDEYSSHREAGLPTTIEMIPEPNRGTTRSSNQNDGNKNADTLQNLEVVQHAYEFFETFKGLIADLIFSFRERSQSREFFLKRTAEDAFKVVEAELNFFYEILYTKVVVVQCKEGYFFRIVSFCLNWAALALFYLMEKDKLKLEKFDIGITYTLLLGAIALDAIAVIMAVFSDWTVVILSKSKYRNSWFIKGIIKCLRSDCIGESQTENSSKSGSCSFGKIGQIACRRWSESLSQYNLIHYCLYPRVEWWRKIIESFGLTSILDGIEYTNRVPFTSDLRGLIFEELRMKSEMADDLDTAKDIFSARGDWVLRFEGCTNLLPWINGVDFDESLLLWHIATELCFSGIDHEPKDTNDEKSFFKLMWNRMFCSNTDEINANTKTKGGNIKKDLSKVLSDYMLYLLIMQPTLMSPVAGIGQIRFRDTCEEAKKFFRGRKIGNAEGVECCPNIFAIDKCFSGTKSENGKPQSQATDQSCMNIFCFCCLGKKTGPDELQRRACKSILAVDTVVKPVAVKGDRSKSVLFDACMLAKELNKLDKRKWEIMSKVWVELLSYAASRCRAYTHAAQLSKGGQLITLVWLLLAHLGLGDQFQISEGHARAKLIVDK